MNKHTPGPWFYRRGDEWSHSVVTLHGGLPDGSPNCWEIASINKKREPEHVANAHLIAAAPELLEALEGLFADYKQLADSGDAGFWKLEDFDVGKKALSAIAKARGEV